MSLMKTHYNRTAVSALAFEQHASDLKITVARVLPQKDNIINMMKHYGNTLKSVYKDYSALSLTHLSCVKLFWNLLISVTIQNFKLIMLPQFELWLLQHLFFRLR